MVGFGVLKRMRGSSFAPSLCLYSNVPHFSSFSFFSLFSFFFLASLSHSTHVGCVHSGMLALQPAHFGIACTLQPFPHLSSFFLLYIFFIYKMLIFELHLSKIYSHRCIGNGIIVEPYAT